MCCTHHYYILCHYALAPLRRCAISLISYLYSHDNEISNPAGRKNSPVHFNCCTLFWQHLPRSGKK